MDWSSGRTRTTGAYGVPGENDNGRKVVFCAERMLYMGNKYFERRSLHKYTKLARGEDEVDQDVREMG